MISLAISRGRLMEETIENLKKAGFEIPAFFNRGLIFSIQKNSLNLILAKDFDIPLFVEYGIADLGICGRDVLLEIKPEVYQLENLGFGKCFIALAGPENLTGIEKLENLKVATKYYNVATEFLKSLGRPFKVIKLNGSVELACVTGLSDLIVDVVKTGKTLKDNGLKVLRIIHESSAHLICNKVKYRQKYIEIEEFRRRLKNATN